MMINPRKLDACQAVARPVKSVEEATLAMKGFAEERFFKQVPIHDPPTPFGDHENSSIMHNQDFTDKCVAQKVMKENVTNRLIMKEMLKFEHSVLKFPVALFFVRGDRGGTAKDLAEQTMTSLNYWDLDSAHYIDIIFPGWDKTEKSCIFNTENFFQFKNEIEASSEWRYGGESEILLINYHYFVGVFNGQFVFNEVISLPIEDMIKRGITSSIDALMNDIITASKTIKNPGVWEISDKLAIQKGRKSLWEFLKKKFTVGLSKIYDDFRPFAVCNLEKKTL